MSNRHYEMTMAARHLFCLFWAVLTVALPVHVQAQVSYGGAPLTTQAEAFSAIGAPVDYFSEFPSFNIDSLLAIDALPGNRIGGIKFAHTFFTNLAPENSGVNFTTDEGMRVWKIGIRSPGAYSLNVIFSEFNLPDGASVFLYNSDQTCVLGAFTNKNRPNGGEFCVAPVEGDELTIEYQEPVDAPFKGNIRITEVNHDYLGLIRTGTRFNQLDLPCLPDVSCETAYDQLSRSTCLLIINGNTYCTGTLVNNTAQDGKPYLITAAHCLQNNSSLGSRVVAFLNYQSPRCDQRIRGSEEFSVSGSQTKALCNEVDLALLKLEDLPPTDYRPYLAGWTTDVTTTAAPFVSLHHPKGEVLKYALEVDSLIPTSWTGLNDGIAKGNHWKVSRWEKGHTWYGSSGAPLFDKNNRLLGVLTGGDSGGEAGCDTTYTGDFYYRFYRAWDQFSDSTKQLKYWLDPVSKTSDSPVFALDGLDPYASNPAKRLSNLTPNDTVGALMLASPGKGSLVGQNSDGIHQFAEHFTTDTASQLLGVYFMAYKGVYSTESPVNVYIYEGGQKPGKLLAEAMLNPSYKDFSSGQFIRITKTQFSNAENYLRFDNPITVDSDFYVSYQVDQTLASPSDSFYVYAALRTASESNSAYYFTAKAWYPFTEHSKQPVHTSLWIEPIVVKDTTSGNDPSLTDDSLDLDEPIIYWLKDRSEAVVSFPSTWDTTVTLLLYDLSGKLLTVQQGQPPTITLNYPIKHNQLYLVKLFTNKYTRVLKLMIR